MSEKSEETAEARADWLTHPYTQRQIGLQVGREKKALDRLLEKCASSTDPAVRDVHARYVETKVMTEWLTSGVTK